MRVTGLVAAAENAVGGNALRPGDVLRHYGGRTTEVTNTDAEGRLVLADALAYAVAELDPVVVVDIATLTGAMKVALGQQHRRATSPTTTRLADVLREAGRRRRRAAVADAAGARLRGPPVLARSPTPTTAPSTPAPSPPPCSCSTSSAGRPWAHLDIASVGDSPGERHEWTTGPTGFGVRLLLRWLTGPDPLDGIG